MATSLTKELRLAVPTPKLWDAMMDAHILAKAVKPVVTGVELEGEPGVIGCVRTIHFNAELVGFPYVKEKLTVLDESSKTIGSSVVEGGFVGTQLKSHSATMTVKPDGETGSILVWELSYEPLVANPSIDQIVEGFVKSMEAVEAYLQKN